MSFLRAVYQANWRVAYANINGCSMYEMLRLLDQIDRTDLASLKAAAPASQFSVNMDRIQWAISVVQTRALPSAAPGDLGTTGQVSDGRNFLSRRNPLRIPSDPTGFFPNPANAVPGLSAADYANAAANLGVENAVVRAVAQVESGGRTGFSADGRPIIRYELHRFEKRTGRHYHATHPHLSQPSLAAGNPYHVGGQANEWRLLYGAMELLYHEEDAISSTSWGMFQVMGEHAVTLGWPDAWNFAYDMCESAAAHLDAFLSYCRVFGLVRHMVNKNWAAFAAGYNGPLYAVNHYDVNMAAAYAHFKSLGY